MEVIDFKSMIWDLTRQISDEMDELFRPLSARYGLTQMQVRVLMELWATSESQTVGNLSKKLGVNNGNMSATCKKLEQEGFLSRFRDTQDERVVQIALSDKGKETVQEIDQIANQKYAVCLCKMGKERMDDIAADLREIHALLREMLDTGRKRNVK